MGTWDCQQVLCCAFPGIFWAQIFWFFEMIFENEKLGWNVFLIEQESILPSFQYPHAHFYPINSNEFCLKKNNFGEKIKIHTSYRQHLLCLTSADDLQSSKVEILFPVFEIKKLWNYPPILEIMFGESILPCNLVLLHRHPQLLYWTNIKLCTMKKI